MTDLRNRALRFALQERPRFKEEYFELVSIPSVSTDPTHKPDMLRTAEWLAAKLAAIGLEHVQILSTDGHPVIYADHLHAGVNRPTVLIYGHYDVQPVDPIELWKTPPFEPTQLDGYTFARGASDMKAQISASISAVEALLSTGVPHINLKFMLEGEEEIGSPNLPAFMRKHKELLTADFALNPDAGMISAVDPTIVTGLRGLAYFELRVYGPRQDLHSGLYGGVVKNPAIALAELVAGMHDVDGRVTLPGFYEDVVPLSEQDRDDFRHLPIGADYYLEQTGALKISGEQGYTPSELIGARPTLDVNGLFSGFIGEGSKTVIPAWAMAKISTRLVANQTPEKVKSQMESYLHANAPDSIRWELTPMAGGPAYLAQKDAQGSTALAEALETVWGKKPLYKREGGSVPVVSEMKTILGIDSLLTGFGLPDDNIHSPNERMHMETWYKGIDALIHFFYNL